ncbi:MAG: sulfotransferase [Proteobacteria bacterium]|nr:sulfotransferase [Pseudomonadota bacterium]
MSLGKAGRMPAAFQAFYKAVEIQPNHAQAARNAGQILKNAGNTEQAAAILGHARELASGDRKAMLALIDVLSMAGMTGEAEVMARQALESHPSDPDIAVQLGNICMAKGTPAEAAELARSALAARPDLIGALSLLAETAGGDEAAEILGKIESLGAGRGQPPHVTVSLSFSAGRLCERLKRHGEAFDYFAAGNRARRDLLAGTDQRYRRDRMEAEVAELIDAFPAAAFANPGGSESELPVFIVGMPRSGTTLTEQILASHSMAAGAGELSEIGNIVRWLRREHGFPHPPPRDLYPGIASGYLTQMRRVDPGAARITDKMPGNFMNLGLIALLFPNARIIHCRRDPMDTCLSCFTQNFRSEGLAWSCDLDDVGHYYCQYRRLMDHWLSVLPAGRILEFDYELTVSALEEQARRLIGFAGLKWDDACLRFSDTDRIVLTASRNQVRKGVYGGSVGRWRRYGDRIMPLAASLARCGHGPAED